MAYWKPSPLGSFSMTDGSAAEAVRVPKIRARFRSFRPPAKISDVDADAPSTRIATGPANTLARGFTTKLRLVSRMYSAPSRCPAVSINHPAIPIAITPSPPGLPRRSTMKPSQDEHDWTASPNAPMIRGGSRNMLNRAYPIAAAELFTRPVSIQTYVGDRYPKRVSSPRGTACFTVLVAGLL